MVWFSVEILTLALIPEWKCSSAVFLNVLCGLSLAPSKADGCSSLVEPIGQVS